MRSLGIFGGLPAFPSFPGDGTVLIDDVPVRSRIMRSDVPAFDPTSEENARRVVVQVRAFSLNYRDKSFMVQMQTLPRNRFFAVGSELTGTVLEVGAEVRGFKPGDRVMGQNHFVSLKIRPGGWRDGVATNQGSKEVQSFHEEKLIRIPDSMPDEIAAAFSLGAQTAYSMIRKAEVEEGTRVLVTSATSSTSGFVIAALKARGARIFATTASDTHDQRLMEMGVEQIVRVTGARSSFRHNDDVMQLARDLDGFEAVIDPFFDLHVERGLEMLLPFGRYVTCGLAGQTEGAKRQAAVQPVNGRDVLLTAMVNNLSIIGNCLGLHADLDAAVADYEAGRFQIPMDSTFTGEDAPGFLNRTYCDRSRFGKVVFRYDDAA